MQGVKWPMVGRKTSNRLFVNSDLAAGLLVPASRPQANYLLNVLRLNEGDPVLLFNGRSGEWRGVVRVSSRRDCSLEVVEQEREQKDGPDLQFLFAPLKRARLDYVIEKATELGAGVIRPVLTRRTIVSRVNTVRMRSNAIEAAEQCGVLRVPEIREPEKLPAVIREWDSARRLIYCDEEAKVSSPLSALSQYQPGPLAVLIGPEGGFEPEERALLSRQDYVVPISLGPRIMRADTAAVAALALVNAALGDWR